MSPRHDRLVALALGVVGASLSVGRLLLANPDALETLVWAEDGLFPLCSKAHGPVACLADPYAGYLLFLPRLVAAPLGALPLEWWPAATNIAAAALAGLASGLAFLVARRFGTGLAAGVILGLLPVAAPIMGFEAVNATASSYMLLVYVVALATCLALPGRQVVPAAALAAGMALATLTIPSAALLLPVVVYQAQRRRLTRRGAAWIVGAGVAGALAQAWVVATAEQRRAITPSWDALRAWADAVPSALLTYVPGRVQLSESGTLTGVVERPWLGVAVCLALAVAGAVLAVRRDATMSAIGLLVLVGLALGSLPAVIGYANNRYFVIPALLWGAALVIGADRLAGRWREAGLAILGAALIPLWWSAMPASAFRSTATPEWPTMLATVQAACESSPSASAALTFTPNWPFADAVLPGPTSNVVDCPSIGLGSS